MFKIREFQQNKEDYRNLAHLMSNVWINHPVTIDELKYHDEFREKKYFRKLYILEYDTHFAGFCDFGERSWAYVKGGYFIEILVTPEYRNKGGGSLLFTRVLDELKDRELVKLSSYTCEDQPEGIRFLKKRGLAITMREPNSSLDVETFNFNQYLSLINTLKKQNIQIVSLSEAKLKIDEWKQKLYDVDWLIGKDIPFPDPPTKPPFDVWERMVFAPDRFNEDTYIVAVDENDIVGISCIKHVPADKEIMITSITGTLRSYRRKGVATAMKAVCIQNAKEIGIKKIITDNEENNPMYTLNMKLGFTPLPAWLQLEKTW